MKTWKDFHHYLTVNNARAVMNASKFALVSRTEYDKSEGAHAAFDAALNYFKGKHHNFLEYPRFQKGFEEMLKTLRASYIDTSTSFPGDMSQYAVETIDKIMYNFRLVKEAQNAIKEMESDSAV